MSESDLTSIPLPREAQKPSVKRSARELLEEALRAPRSSTALPPNDKLSDADQQDLMRKLSTLGPSQNKAKPTESSHSIVDELFKDFIAQKFSPAEKTAVSSRENETVAMKSSSVEEISKILDMEISSIEAHTKGLSAPQNKPQMTIPDETIEEDIPVSEKRKEHRSKSKSEKRSRKHGKSSDKSSSKSRSEKHRSKHLSKKLRSTSSKSEDLCENGAAHINEKTLEHASEPSSASTIAVLQEQTHLTTDCSSSPGTIPDTAGNQCSSAVLTSASDSQIAVKISEEVSEDTRPNAPPSTVSVDKTLAPEVQNSGPSSASHASGADKLEVGSEKESRLKLGLMLPAPVARKMVPKQLGLKLTVQSLSLIKSNERVDRDGRVWEEGEVQSSHSGDSGREMDSDSDLAGYPSDTGSINSNAPDWRSSSSRSRKKHKHKHKKKKKKKSSREQDRSRESSDKEKRKESRSRERTKEKEKKSDKERQKEKSKRHGEKLEREKRRSQETEEGLGASGGHKADKDDGSVYQEEDRKKEKERKRRHGRSRSRSPKQQKRSRTKSRSRSPRKYGRDPSPKWSKYSEWDARHYSDRFGNDGAYRDKGRELRTAEDREKDRVLQIDKAKLRRIAIANALQNMKSGNGPQVDTVTVKSGGKSVAELTDFCKKISEKDQERMECEVSDSSEEERVKSEEDEPLINHPFKVRDPTSNIIMNIRNARQLPVLTPSEKQAQQASLRLTFPVSSGTAHRANEAEWVPVEKPSVPASTTASAGPTTKPRPVTEAPQQPVPESSAVPSSISKNSGNIFPQPSSTQNLDIGSIISERLQAVRKLQENPYDMQALSKMHRVQEKANEWASSKHLPGQFTGSTGAQVMSQQEIIGDRRHQAWAKKTQFTHATPINGGIGMFLLQKMGWKQGEGLGKNNEGSKEPLMLDIKIDRKGLTTTLEVPQAKPNVGNVPRAKDLSSKHPVSALMELCNKRRWGPPIFTVVSESGPDHKKNFLFKVKVNNVEYQPSVASSNKKTAKAECAGVCLQEMGLIPRGTPLNI